MTKSITGFDISEETTPHPTEIERLRQEVAELRKTLAERRIAPMANPSRYTGVPGFNIESDDDPTPSTPPLERSLIDNHELIVDLARFSESLCTESAIRKKWRLSEETWERLGSSDELVRAIEEEKTRRVRSGATKRELAQQHIVRGPAVLASIMDDPRQSARHRVDSVKALDSLDANESKDATEQDRIIIRIEMGADLRAKGQEPGPGDVVIIEAPARPSTPKQIEDDHNEQPSDEWRR